MTYAVIYNIKGKTEHVDVYLSKKIAKEEALLNNGLMIKGINNIINACTWWNANDSFNYRRKWVIDNRI